MIKISDKALGYLILVLILGGALLITLQMYQKNRQTRHIVKVLFEEVGTLQPQDPVVDRGMPVGQVVSVTYLDNRALVVIQFEEPVLLFEGVEFINENYSLMGARWIRLINKRGNPVITDSSMVFAGVFEPGIAEAMHKVEGLKNQITGLHEMVRVLALGDSANPSLIQFFNESFDAVQRQVNALNTLMETQQGPWVNTFAEVEDLSEKSLEFSINVSSKTRRLTQLTQEELNSLARTVESLNNGIVYLNDMVDKFQKSAIYKPLFENKEFIQVLAMLMKTVKNVEDFLGKDGLTFTDDQGKTRGITSLGNINLFGATSRELRAREK